MKIAELREKTDVELDRMLAELRGKTLEMRFKVAGRQLKGLRGIREAKKTIARILTLKKSRRK
jgi:large subunit ribosomal protein L29